MSNDSKTPDDTPKGKINPPSKPKNEQTEVDLWDLDDEQEPKPEAPTERTKSTSIPSPRSKESSIESRKPVERNIETPVPAIDTENVGTDESPDTDTTTGSPATEAPTEQKAPKSSNTSSAEDKEPDTSSSEETDTPATEVPPVIFSKSYISSLSKVEKIGIVTLVAILCVTAILSIVHFSNSLAIKSLLAEDLELPIEGELVTISSVETYWREPITEGENKDVVRRGVQLIPVVRLNIESTSSSSSAIRVLFRDADEIVIGDNISRSIPNQGILEISATDGFSDLGMHAAYRTGESARWTVQVLEGPSVNAPIEQFDTLFETEISTHMR